MTSFKIEPSDDVPDTDWVEQHGDDDDDQVVSVADVEADPADRLDQVIDVPQDDEDGYDRT